MTEIAISVVIPLWNERESLAPLHAELQHVLQEVGEPYEILFVDDGSTDGSREELRMIRQKDPRMRVISFRRNLGKSAALAVGFQKARGHTLVTLDADLQDDPAEIPHFLGALAEGYDLVSGWKKERQDPPSKTLPSRLFNWTIGRLCGLRLHDFNCGFKVYRREVVRHLELYGELHRYIPALAHWAGFRVGEIPVHHRSRTFGRTKFGLARFWRGFFDLLTILFLNRYTRRPMHFFGWIGGACFTVGVGTLIYMTILWFLGDRPIGTRPLFSLGVLLVILGVQIFSFGLMAEMIAYFGMRRPQEDHFAMYLREEDAD